MKTYCVTYETTTGYDVPVKAKSKEEAMKKVLEIIPDAANMEAWELRKKNEARG